MDATLKPEMLELLSSMKGKVFKSYECVNTSSLGDVKTFGNFRINLGRSAIEIDCPERIVDYFGRKEDVYPFECTAVDLASPFHSSYFEDMPRSYMVDEVITGVEVIRDHVDYDQGDYVTDMDVALIIYTKYHSFVFAKDNWFMELIVIETFEAGQSPKLKTLEQFWLGRKTLAEAAAEGITAERTVVAL